MPPLVPPYLKAFEMDAAVERSLSELSNALGKGRAYESFTLQSKIDKVRKLIGEMKEAIHDEVESRNEQEAMSYDNLKGIVRSKIARHLLRLTELIRKKENRTQMAEERRQKFDSSEREVQQDVALMDNQEAVERTRERQRISIQISEIGQIMEEISVHVSLQEESFRRIDELMETSDGLISGSLDLMKSTWENVSKTRSAIVKFLLFWVVLSLIFWLLRR